MTIQLKFLLAVLNRPTYHIILDWKFGANRYHAFIFFNKKLLIKEKLDRSYSILSSYYPRYQQYITNNVIFTNSTFVSVDRTYTYDSILSSVDRTYTHGFIFPSRTIYIRTRGS